MSKLNRRANRAAHLLAALALLALFPAQHAPAARLQTRATPAKPQPQQAPSAQSADPLAPLLAQAQEALDRNDFTAAIPLLEKIVAAKPADALPHFELGFAYSGLKKNPEAIAEYRRAISLDPNLAPAHLNLGLTLLDADPAAAAASFARAAELLPGQARPRYLQAEALERSGKRSDAIQQYHAAAALAPQDDTILFALSRALFADGQPAGAEAGFRQVLVLKPDFAPAQLGLAEALLKQQKVSESVDAFRDYLQKSPDDRAARFERAVALQDLNRFDDSLAELDRLDRDAAPTAESLKLRGSIYIQQKKWAEADAAFTKALTASPGDAQLHAWMGHTKMELHDYAAAQNELRRALEIAPANVDPLRELVGAYYLAGQYPATLSALDLLAQRETPTALDWFFRALSCDKLSKKPEAAAAYQKFLELDRGERPDQEFQARERLKPLLRELGSGTRK